MKPEQLQTVLAAFGAPAIEVLSDEKALADALAAAFGTRTVQECVDTLHAVGAGGAALTSLPELMEVDGIADRRGLRIAQWSDRYGHVVAPGPGIRFSRTTFGAGIQPSAACTDTARLRLPARVDP
jgi:crotonobetainyl-CoA:carnitine CoA-transferase CaiB-like acyl-CoA transferase